MNTILEYFGYIVIFSNLTFFIIYSIGINRYKSLFYEIGLPVYKNVLQINKNHLINSIGNKIIKKEVKLKIISENKIYFICNVDIIKNFIFGECIVIDNFVKIIYKTPNMIITLILPLYCPR